MCSIYTSAHLGEGQQINKTCKTDRSQGQHKQNKSGDP